VKYTPVRLIPYLEDTDAMRDVPGILKALAERVEQLLTEASS
jgi:hypothetical protein